MAGRLQIFSGNSNPALANEVATHLGQPLGKALVGTYRDGETRVRIEENVRGCDVFVMQSISAPADHHLLELLLMIDALRRASAARITAVIPYYGYAKQEKKTAGREPISAKLVANLLMTAGATRVLTIDLHTPAIEGFFDIPVDHLRATPLLADYFHRLRLQEVVVVSPDAGGVGRAADFRERVGGNLAIIAKTRPEPDRSEVVEMVGEVEGRPAIIVDDMISTGGTLIAAARALHERGAREIYAAATHAVFAPGGITLERDSLVRRIVVTNTVPVLDGQRLEDVEVITVAPLLAEAIMRINKDLSVSALFI